MNNLENCIILKQNKDGTIRLSRLNKKSIEFGNCLKDFLGTTLNRISFQITGKNEYPDNIVDLDLRVENKLALTITFKQENDLLKYGYSTYVWFSYSNKLKSFLKLDYPVQTDMRLYNVCIDTICSKYLETVYIKPYQKRGDIT